MRLLPILLLTACATADAGSFYGAGASSSGATAAEARQYGIQIDWTSVTTIEIQEGQRIADDGTTFTVSTPLAVTFADIDTGAEASSTGYYLWLTGDASAVLSLSATAPTGVSGGKYLAGWVYNDSGSDLYEFRTSVRGDSLDVYWHEANFAVSVASPSPTTPTAVDVSTTGRAPSSTLTEGLYLYAESYNDGALYISWNNSTASRSMAHFGATLAGETSNTLDGYLATQGSTFYWWRSVAGSGDQTYIQAQGFRLDRSGI